jgi:hypothetical protein
MGDGEVCGSAHRLEFDHDLEVALGGKPSFEINGSDCFCAAAAVRVGGRPRAAEAQPEGAHGELAAPSIPLSALRAP